MKGLVLDMGRKCKVGVGLTHVKDWSRVAGVRIWICEDEVCLGHIVNSKSQMKGLV